MIRTCLPLIALVSLILASYTAAPIRTTVADPIQPPHTADAVQQQADALSPGGFVEVTGDQLTRLGQPVQLKGAYYVTHDHSPEEMWRYWDANRIAHDLTYAHDMLGINAVWVKLPYIIRDVAPEGYVTEELVLRMRELIQIAASRDMRVVFSLFDNYEVYPMPGKRREGITLNYLYRLLDNFKTDERVLGWDIQYHPDNRGVNQQQVISWLVRIANHAQQYAPNQLIMASFRNYTNLWHRDFDGHRVLDHVDLVLLRSTDDQKDDILERIADIRNTTDLPIMLIDFDWSSGPPCRTLRYTEEQQAFMHYSMLTLLQEGQIVGTFLNTLYDVDSGPLYTWDSPGFYRGMFRPDLSPKPVAEQMQLARVAPLPSTIETNLPLRTIQYKPTREEGTRLLVDTSANPLQIEGTPYYVKDWFRVVWDTFGGQNSFGLPLTNAYKRAEDGRVVQYFEAAVMELHTGIIGSEEYAVLGRIQKIQAVVRMIPIGSAYTVDRAFPAPAYHPRGDGSRYFPETNHYVHGTFYDFYQQASGFWRLGAPLSEQIEETINDVPMTIQYFERGRLEWNEEQQAFQLGQLGTWAFDVQCTYQQ